MANIPIWPGSSSFGLVADPTPFGFYDSDDQFRIDADKVSQWVVQRLGYPLVDIELVSLAHFRGRTFENSVVIVDEFQNLTRSQFRMALGRLGKGSTMIFCGDNQQIDLKDKNYSAIHDLSKISPSQYVYKRVLEDNHRHVAIDEVFELLNGM